MEYITPFCGKKKKKLRAHNTTFIVELFFKKKIKKYHVEQKKFFQINKSPNSG